MDRGGGDGGVVGGRAGEVGDGATRALADAVRDAAAGDERAFAVVVAHLEPVARRSAHRAARTLPQLDVDEVVSIAMARLWRALPRFDQDREVLPWAAVVIAHAVRSAARAARSQRSTMNWGAMLAPVGVEDEPAARLRPTSAAAGEDEVVAAVLAAEQGELVRAVLAEVLSDREARALRMRLAGGSYAEIAEMLQIDDKAVDNALRRAGTKLRRAFGDEDALTTALDGTRR